MCFMPTVWAIQLCAGLPFFACPNPWRREVWPPLPFPASSVIAAQYPACHAHAGYFFDYGHTYPFLILHILSLGDIRMKKFNWKPYALWILITEAVGALSGWLTREGNQVYQQTIQQPPFVSAAPGFSHRLGDSVCPDGLQRCKNISFTAFRSPKQRTEPVYRAIGGQFLLEPDFLQCPGLRLCLCLAAAPVGAGSRHDPDLPHHRPHRRLASDSVSDLAHIRRLPESGCVVPESITESPA